MSFLILFQAEFLDQNLILSEPRNGHLLKNSRFIGQLLTQKRQIQQIIPPQNSSNFKMENKVLNITTPDGSNILLEIIDVLEKDSILKGSPQIVHHIPTIFGKLPIYALADDNYLIQYTVDNSYALRVKGRSNLAQLFLSDSHSFVELLKDRNNSNEYYYAFSLWSDSIRDMIQREHCVIDGYGRELYLKPGKSDVTMDKVVEFKDGSVIIFHERAENVFQGYWFPNFENFKYFYDNDFC